MKQNLMFVLSISIAILTGSPFAQENHWDTGSNQRNDEPPVIGFISEPTDWEFYQSFGLAFAQEAAIPWGSLYSYLQTCATPNGDPCHRTIDACAPLEMVKQTPKKTVIRAGAWRATRRENLTGRTYLDRMECEKAAGLEPTGAVGIALDEKTLTIVRVLFRSPAEQAGIRVGYRLLKVDGNYVDSMPAAMRLLAGVPDSQVEITTSRNGVETPYVVTRKPWSDVYQRKPDQPAHTE